MACARTVRNRHLVIPGRIIIELMRSASCDPLCLLEQRANGIEELTIGVCQHADGECAVQAARIG
jgi:hypothetical protein